MTTQTIPVASKSVRELIAELADVEDQVRQLRTSQQSVDAPTQQALHPDLVGLLHREADIVASIRRTAATLRS
ncbi:hypothetical protein [Flexivirga sp. B27]